MQLVIGDKTYSSWSMRPWLALKRAGVGFEELKIRLRNDGTKSEIAPLSPSGQVPALRLEDGLVIWDSLAICEWVAERYPEATLWPADPSVRALGRAAASEMHGGFTSLRGECPMDLGKPPSNHSLSEATAINIRRIVALWSDLIDRFGGPFLLGETWSIADAFYTPVASRFLTYGVHPSDYGDLGPAGVSCDRLLEQPEFVEWAKGAAEERAQRGG